SLAITRNTAIDDTGIDFLQGFIVYSKAELDIGPHVLDDNIRILDEFEENLPPLVTLQIEAQRALVAMQVLEIPAIAPADEIIIYLPCFNPLVPQNLGPPVGKLVNRHRAGAGVREVKHAKTLQWPPGGVCL